MTINVHVSLSVDLTIGINTHCGLNPAMGLPKPVEVPSIECPATMLWPPGYALNKNKLTSTVTLNDFKLVLDGHDLGPLLLDFTPWPAANAWYAVMWPFSSRKTSFSAACVQADSTPIAGSQLAFPLPLVTCGDPMALPTSMNMLSMTHNVIVGFSLSDVVFGYLSILAAAAVDLLFGKATHMLRGFRLAAGARSAAGRSLLRRISQAGTKGFGRAGLRIMAQQRIADEFATRALGLSAKGAVAGIVDGALSYARGQVNGTHEYSVKLTVGSSVLGGELSYTGSPDSNRRGAQAQVGAGPVQVSAPLNSRPITTQVLGEAGPSYLNAPAAPTKPAVPGEGSSR